MSSPNQQSGSPEFGGVPSSGDTIVQDDHPSQVASPFGVFETSGLALDGFYSKENCIVRDSSSSARSDFSLVLLWNARNDKCFRVVHNNQVVLNVQDLHLARVLYDESLTTFMLQFKFNGIMSQHYFLKVNGPEPLRRNLVNTLIYLCDKYEAICQPESDNMFTQGIARAMGHWNITNIAKANRENTAPGSTTSKSKEVDLRKQLLERYHRENNPFAPGPSAPSEPSDLTGIERAQKASAELQRVMNITPETPRSSQPMPTIGMFTTTPSKPYQDFGPRKRPASTPDDQPSKKPRQSLGGAFGVDEDTEEDVEMDDA